MAAAAWLEPGCVVLDLHGLMWSAVDVLDRLVLAAPDHPVVVCGCGDVALAVAAMKHGAADVLDQPVGLVAIAEAVSQALETQPVRVTTAPSRSAAIARVATLTPRQRGVLRGVLSGKSNKVIARELGLSARTVECHRAAIMMRTGTRNFSDLIRIGIAAGL